MSFHIAYTEGIFEGEGLFVREDEKDKAIWVTELLAPLLNQSVRLALVQAPPGKIDPEKWGGGCCLWQSKGYCPAGHHQDPYFLLNFAFEGVLSKTGDTFHITVFDGSVKTLPLPQMEGHYGRLAVATLLDVEKMRDALHAKGV